MPAIETASWRWMKSVYRHQCHYLIDRYGRRNLLMTGSVGMVFFLGMLSKAFFTNKFSEFGGYGVMIYLMGFIAFFAFLQGAVIWVVISEIFPNKLRAKGQALGSFTHWIMAAAISWSFPVFANMPSIGGGPSFAFFAVMMVLHFFFAWKILPETKGKSLEEIQVDMGNLRNKAIKISTLTDLKNHQFLQ